MKIISRVNKGSLVFFATLVCLFAASSISAFAVPPNQVVRLVNNPSFTATCCIPIGPTVALNEPTNITPVIVIWSVDYMVSGESAFALSVNGGPCLFFGPATAPFVSLKGGSGLTSSTYQWVVKPGEGLVHGLNQFTVCAGGVGGSTGMFLGGRTLSVQIGK